MNYVEGRARPILRPLIRGQLPPLLTANNQRRLAVWACLRAYIVESGDRRHLKFSTRDERLAFAANNQRIPPNNTIVWLARFPGPEHRRGDLCGSKRVVLVTHTATVDALQAFTFFLGKVAFQVLQWRGNTVRIQGQEPSNVGILLQNWKSRVIEIWPKHFRRGADLPDPLTVSEADAFFKRFRGPARHANLSGAV